MTDRDIATDAELDRLRARIAELEAQLAERDTSFNLRWNADMQAIQRWQAETGEELKWPNHVDLCVWLMQALAAAQERIAELEAQLAEQPAMTDEVRNVILAALTEYEDARNKFWDGHPDAMRDRDEARAAIAYLTAKGGRMTDHWQVIEDALERAWAVSLRNNSAADKAQTLRVNAALAFVRVTQRPQPAEKGGGDDGE